MRQYIYIYIYSLLKFVMAFDRDMKFMVEFACEHDVEFLNNKNKKKNFLIKKKKNTKKKKVSF